MRVGIVSDTHGTLDERVLHAVGGSDVIVHAGDVGDARVLRRLRAVTARVVAVRGNNDIDGKLPAAGRRSITSLPTSAKLELPGGVLVVVHGDRVNPARERHSKLRAAHPDARLVVYGHSHRLCVDCAAEPWVANPGAAGRARTFGGPSLLMLDAAISGWRLSPTRFERPG